MDAYRLIEDELNALADVYRPTRSGSAGRWEETIPDTATQSGLRCRRRPAYANEKTVGQAENARVTHAVYALNRASDYSLQRGDVLEVTSIDGTSVVPGRLRLLIEQPPSEVGFTVWLAEEVQKGA